jgi:hypothetical protein
LRVGELRLRATHALRTVNSLSAVDKKKVESDRAGLDSLKAKRDAQMEALTVLKAFVQIGEALDKLRKRSAAAKTEIALLSLPEIGKLSEWDPRSSEGKHIADAVAALEIAIAEQKKAHGIVGKRHDAGAAPPDAGVNDAEAPSLPSPSSEVLASPAYQRLTAHLDVLIERVRALIERLDSIGPGDVPELEKWALTPDVLGNIPDAVRETAVVESLHKLELMLGGAASPGGADTPSLIRRLNSGIDRLNELNKAIETSENRPGAKEFAVQTGLLALEHALAKGVVGAESDAVDRQIDQLIESMTTNNLYISQMKGAPELMARFENLLKPERIEKLSMRLDTFATTLERGDWVVIDREIPLDKLWVVLVYGILLMMIVINVKKLLRFWRAYKQ